MNCPRKSHHGRFNHKRIQRDNLAVISMIEDPDPLIKEQKLLTEKLIKKGTYGRT